jgi:hypothetical protein
MGFHYLVFRVLAGIIFKKLFFDCHKFECTKYICWLSSYVPAALVKDRGENEVPGPVSSYQVLSRFDSVLGCKQKKATDVPLLSFQSFRKDCLEVFRKSMYVHCGNTALKHGAI